MDKGLNRTTPSHTLTDSPSRKIPSPTCASKHFAVVSTLHLALLTIHSAMCDKILFLCCRLRGDDMPGTVSLQLKRERGSEEVDVTITKKQGGNSLTFSLTREDMKTVLRYK
eukprot:3499456-Rhodomonas_salina.1